MNENLIHAKSAYKKGLRKLVLWPILLILLLLTLSTYLTIEGFLTPLYMIMVVFLMVLGYFVYFISAAPKWQEWMLVHSKNPKTTLELAMKSFLKYKHVNKLFLWGADRKEEFNRTYQERINELKVAAAQKGKEKFDASDVFRAHEKVGNLWFLLFLELFAAAAGVYLIWNFSLELALMGIAVFLTVTMFVLFLLSARSIWKKKSNVLVLSKNGVEVNDLQYGWDEIQKIDTIREEEFYLKAHDGTTEKISLKPLNKTAEEIEEAMLFFGGR
jgi:ABC-type multidrug transport system fused ATPase/permease subunit